MVLRVRWRDRKSSLRAVVYRQYARFGCVRAGFDSQQPDKRKRGLWASFSFAVWESNPPRRVNLAKGRFFCYLVDVL